VNRPSTSGPVEAAAAPARAKPTNYPEPFAAPVAGRIKRPLADLFGIKAFGVNLTTLPPGASSALHHSHSRQDEFVYVVEGELTLHLGDEAMPIRAGECVGFPAGGPAHHLENRGEAPATYLEVGDRAEGDVAAYPDDDLQAALVDGRWVFQHKDGRPY
jgi:uncharacterized cupin superfamily protein